MYCITRKKLSVFALLAAVMLLGVSWRFGWFDREPSYRGKTVTEWLDRLVLYSDEQRSNGDGFTIYRAPNAITNDPAFQALRAIGSRAVPVLLERISEAAEFPSEMRWSKRWSVRLQWAWFRLRGPMKAARPYGDYWPPSQTARKTAAMLALLALGTNGHGGFPRFVEAYDAAPQFTSVYGAHLPGPPVGFSPPAAFRLACSTCPQLRDEFVSGVLVALQDTNPACQSVAADCTLVAVPELHHIFVLARQKAWPQVAACAQIEMLRGALRLRPEWKGRAPNPAELSAFQDLVRIGAVELAQKARAFAAQFPTNEFAPEARHLATRALCQAIAAGDDHSEAELKQFVMATLADQSIPEDNRVLVLLASGTAPMMKKLGMRQFIERPNTFSEEKEEGFKESVREVIKQFPKNGTGYTLLLAIASRANDAEQKRLAREILDMEGALPAVKVMARHLIDGTKPFQFDHPIDIAFTALDGREVNMAALKGKVVLVDFWATDCGRCVGEIPQLKAVYEEFHAKGFEILGVSLDDKESTLRRFIGDKSLPWPQYFDGKGWGNRFALQYGIFGIPTKWLLDRRGNLRNTDVQNNLSQQVKQLLEETP